jgi:hypothetical protein
MAGDRTTYGALSPERTELRDLSLQANYIDRATAACREVSANFCG